MQTTTHIARLGAARVAWFHDPDGNTLGLLAELTLTDGRISKNAKGFDEYASPDDTARFAPVAFPDIEAHRGLQAS